MKILLLTAGTRGDVEPFAALARYASGRGHQVRLAAPDNSGVDMAGLDAVSLHVDFTQLISDQGVSPRTMAAAYRSVIRPAVGRMLSAAVEHILSFAPDVVVYHPKILSAPMAAASIGVPSVIVETVPSMTPTREFPAPYITAADLGPLNRASYRAASLANIMFRSELAAALKALPAGKKPVPGTRVSLIPLSPHLLPRPKDWPPSVHLTGHWACEAAAPCPDAELDDFMAGGDFVYAGFGSMKDPDGVRHGAAIIEAARRNGLRALVTTGWGGLEVPGAAGDGVLVRKSVPHRQVLPRASLAVHHGGAGTVHAVARAGIPSVVVPFLADQPFWGRILHGRGLAPEPIPPRQLSLGRLTDAIAQAEECRERAQKAGELIRREDGIAVSMGILEGLA